MASISLPITGGAGSTFLESPLCLPPGLSLEVGKLLHVFLSIVCLFTRAGCSSKARSVTEDAHTPHPFLPLANRRGPCFQGLLLKGCPTPSSRYGMQDSPHAGRWSGAEGDGQTWPGFSMTPPQPTLPVGPIPPASPQENFTWLAGCSGRDESICQSCVCVCVPTRES